MPQPSRRQTIRTDRVRITLSSWILVAVAIAPLVAFGQSVAVDAGIDANGRQFFENHIRPILSEHCYKCHSTQSIRVRSGLRLDSRQAVLQGGDGGPILVPGKPEQSRLIEAVRWTNPDFQMPPSQRLSDDQIAKFEQWVTMGAPDPRDAPPQSAEDDNASSWTTEQASKQLWVLRPLVRPAVPSGLTESSNPIDAFIADAYQRQGLSATDRAERSTLLRRVYLDLTGIPPTLDEQEAFLNDPSPDAYEKVVDRLLESQQHGVRYARHWLDVLRYADVDERMIAARGIYLWRDWIINALNDDLPYDQFIRTQLTGYRTTTRTRMTATGYRVKADPRPDDLFALGLLARGAVIRDGKQEGELAISAVETLSSALMGMTVACAKCHDHVYDPIRRQDYYAMKALFDPLVPRKITLATADDLFASGRAAQELADRRAPIEAKLEQLVGPYKQRLYDERVEMLPADVRGIIRKPQSQRTVAEQKIADDYFPILRIDAPKILEIMSDADRSAYDAIQRELRDMEQSGSGRRPSLTEFWTVEVDPKKETETSYVLTSGDPERPELDHPVAPGWPFAPRNLEFRDGRIEAFSDWLTAPENPLFARVAMNRLWQWHFGEGLHKQPSDYGSLAGEPTHPELLDWLASEFVRQGFRMKAMHRLIVTSDTYQLASHQAPEAASSNRDIDPANRYLWHFPLQRLGAEPIWDSIFAAAGMLDLTVGGPSFSPESSRRGRRSVRTAEPLATYRRAAYMTRGYSTSRDVMSGFLQAFDVDDGRTPCPQRTQTVTATQGLFMMNSEEIERATTQFAARLLEESEGDLAVAIDLGYRIALTRSPTAHELERGLAYLQDAPSRLKGLAWLLFNLDEFIYVR